MSRPPFGYRPPSWAFWILMLLAVALYALLTSCQKKTTKPSISGQTTTPDLYKVLVAWQPEDDSRVAGYMMHLRNRPTAAKSVDASRLIDAGNTPVGVVPNLLLGEPYSLALSAYSASGQSSAETNPIVFILSGDGQLPVPLRNLSTRGFVQTGDRVMIGGFIVAARGSYLIRGLGPSLSDFGITDPLLDPTVAVYKEQTKMAENDDWTGNEAELRAAVGDTLLPKNPKESALIITLDPGNYTVVLSGANQTSGTGLVEVYYIP